jgi:hypothetical protein
MDLVGDLVNQVLGPIVNNPNMQLMAWGLFVKFAVDRVKVFFKQVDENGVPEGYKIHLQIVVAVCAAIASMGQLALNKELSTYNTQLIANFLTTVLPVYAAAVFSHKIGNATVGPVFDKESHK